MKRNRADLKTLISDHLGSILNSEIAKNMQYGVQGEEYELLGSEILFSDGKVSGIFISDSE